jgi:hypothetical protein
MRGAEPEAILGKDEVTGSIPVVSSQPPPVAVHATGGGVHSTVVR